MKKLSTIILSCLLIYCVVLTTACPSRATLEKAEKASSRIAGYADETVNVLRELYRAGVLTNLQTQTINGKILTLAKAGKEFDAAIANLKAQYGADVPQDVLAQIVGLFQSGIVDSFIAALTALKLVNISGELRRMITLLQTTILIVARALQVERTTKAKFAEVQI